MNRKQQQLHRWPAHQVWTIVPLNPPGWICPLAETSLIPRLWMHCGILCTFILHAAHHVKLQLPWSHLGSIILCKILKSSLLPGTVPLVESCRCREMCTLHHEINQSQTYVQIMPMCHLQTINWDWYQMADGLWSSNCVFLWTLANRGLTPSPICNYVYYLLNSFYVEVNLKEWI